MLRKAQKEHAAELTFSCSEIAETVKVRRFAKLPDRASRGQEGGVKAKV